MNKIEGINTRHYGGRQLSSNAKNIKKACQTPAPFDEFYKAAIAKEMKGVKENA